jgi:hypothetical protein
MLKNNLLIKGGLALVLLPALWFGCSGSNNNNNGGPGPAVTPAVAPTPTVTIQIPAGASALGTAAYGTNPLLINSPSNVLWVNGDTTAHSATSDTAGLFDTGVIQPGATSSPIPFSSPGAYPYGSSVTGDAGMSGEIDVASPSPSPSPSASPSASPSVSPSPAVIGWSDVTLQQTCTSTKCPAGDGFTVGNDGAYLTGSGSSGHITRAQLNILNIVASTIAVNSEQLGSSCAPLSPLPSASEATLDETFTDGVSQQVYSFDTGSAQACFRGTQLNAKSLYDTMLALALVYDDGTTPTPSPSPSASTAMRTTLR